MLDNMEKFIDKAVVVTYRADGKCLVCSKKSGDLDIRRPMTRVYSELVSRFTKEYLEYLEKNYRCPDCNLINAEIELQ